MRYGVQLDAEKARVVLDVFHRHLGIAQWVGGLQVVAGIGHFSNQATDPFVEFQLQQPTILGGADVLALDQLQVMSDA
ncbi:hypothetical protein D9M68_497230 [compost metagenome]